MNQPESLSRGHLIHLKGPWMVGQEERARRVHLPRDWSSVVADEKEAVHLSRRFHRPTGLAESTRVFLVVPDAWDVTQMMLNDEVIPEFAAEGGLRRFEITKEVTERGSHDLQVRFRTTVEASFLVAVEIIDGSMMTRN